MVVAVLVGADDRAAPAADVRARVGDALQAAPRRGGSHLEEDGKRHLWNGAVDIVDGIDDDQVRATIDALQARCG